MLLSKRAKSKGQAILFPKSNRLGMALVVENHPTPWPWKRLGACWWLKSFWLTLPMLLPNPSTPALGTAEPSLLKDHKQSYQIKYYSFSSLCLSLNSWMRFLSLSGLASTFPETGKSPVSFSLLPGDILPFSPHLSPAHCQRHDSLFSGVAGTLWDTQQRDTPRQYNRSATTQVWM